MRHRTAVAPVLTTPADFPRPAWPLPLGLHFTYFGGTVRLRYEIALPYSGAARLSRVNLHLLRSISMNNRAQIIEVLEGELNAMEDREASEENAIFLNVLLKLIQGLRMLEKGEVPPIFVPKKVKTRGKPVTVRNYRLKAISAVWALREAGYSAEKAMQFVADAHGVTPEAVRKWRRELGKSSEPDDLMMKNTLISNYRLFSWTKEKLQEAVKRAAKGYQAATIKNGK